MYKIHHLKKSYGNRSVLNGINCQFPNNGVVILVGTNGCGKTTFMNVLTEMTGFMSGKIFCNQFAIGSREYKEQIFYIPSDFYLPEFMTGREYLDFILKRYKTSDFNNIEILLEVFDLKGFENELIEKYSFGMKKKIQIIAAFCSGTPYILADELFSGLDFDTVILLEDIIEYQKNKKCFIIVSHDRNTLERFPNHIYIMSKGKLLSYKERNMSVTDMIRQMGGISGKISKLQERFGNDSSLP
ncbi:ABC transporter ATP-binding protein [Streptococcus uberis]|uniref:ATP-binding cassette domain-containing protein n=1 Tax=Streptococcus uberis TaxID=1349 RepID=UPI0012B50E5E|nr:ABC transporter ATP-binding protein [Streptococcus uberis]MTB69517.1 ATP-binding cassette domain-containing protein [Streptococcus uberis]